MTEALDQPKTCFVISPIGKAGGDTRKRSDKLLKYVIKEVLVERQYTVERADQLSEPGIITNQIVKKIIECDVLIADLSEGNPNVFYELAIRHGLKKPFIHMIDASEKIPFDNAQVRTIPFDLSDLDSVANAKAELSAQVKAIEDGKSTAESPISVAFDLDALKSSGNTDEALLATLFEEVSAVRSELRDMRRVRHPRTTRKPVHPTSLGELKAMLKSSGLYEILNTLEQVNIDSFEPGKIEFSSSLTFDEDQKLANDLQSFLSMATNRLWEVEALPF